MPFEKGDVVQVIAEGERRRHPAYGMVGIVLGIAEGKNMVGVTAPLHRDRFTGFRYSCLPCEDNELVKIGVSEADLDLDKIHKTIEEKTKQAQEANPELTAMMEEIKEDAKWRHLAIGSDEAKAHGCTCGEIREYECRLHGHTIKEIDNMQYRMNQMLDESNEEND